MDGRLAIYHRRMEAESPPSGGHSGGWGHRLSIYGGTLRCLQKANLVETPQCLVDPTLRAGELSDGDKIG